MSYCGGQELLSKENGKGTASTHMRLEDDVAVDVFPLLDRKKKTVPLDRREEKL